MATQPNPPTVSGDSSAVDPVSQKIFQLIAAQKRISEDKVTINSSFEELGLDSLDSVNLLFELESAFDISISDDKARAIRNVQDMVDGVKQLIAEKNSSTTASEPSPQK